jgi:hypothetical protein
MNPIAHQYSWSPFHQDDFTSGGSFQTEQTRVGFRSESQHTALSLTTAEGDRVTLSLSTTAETRAGTYSGLTYGPDRVAADRAAFMEQSGSRQATIAIEGDLSDAEWAEIEAAVGIVDGMMDDFRSGDLAGMAQDAETLGEFETISSLEAVFSVERQFGLAQAERLSGHSGPGGRSRSHHGGLRDLKRRMDRLADEMAKVVLDFEGRQDALLQSIDRRFERFRDPAPFQEEAADLALAAVKTIQTEFFEKVMEELDLLP